jgi:hypothetical protein
MSLMSAQVTDVEIVPLWIEQDDSPRIGTAVSAGEAAPAPRVEVAGRMIQPTVVFDTYWRFAAKRQQIYEARQEGSLGPWTDDSILRDHRFTNCFRAADRVSQFLIRDVAYSGSQDLKDLVFRILIFKVFNKIETWKLIEKNLGEIAWEKHSFEAYDQIMHSALNRGERLYSAAYMMPPPHLGEERKHSNHLRLLWHMMESDLAQKLTDSPSMDVAFRLLESYPSIGRFLAFQYLIDINYSDALHFDEMSFVVAGPGACDGLRKCFGAASKGIETELIKYMADTQEEHFSRLGLRFSGLKGQRRLQLIDCQNLFCEVDKYARLAHPDVQGVSGRTRIKQKFAPSGPSAPAWFPPKWNLNDK